MRVTHAIKQLLHQKNEITNSFVYLRDTGKNAHLITIDYFTIMPQTIDDFHALREEINLSVITLLEKENIELASQNMDVVVRNK